MTVKCFLKCCDVDTPDEHLRHLTDVCTTALTFVKSSEHPSELQKQLWVTLMALSYIKQ